MTDILVRKGKDQGCACTFKRTCEDTMTERPNASKEGGLKINKPGVDLGLGFPAFRPLRK